MKPQLVLKEPAAGTAAVTGAASGRTAQSTLEAFAHRTADDPLHKQEKDWLSKGEERYHAFVSRSEDGMWCVEFDQPIPTDLAGRTARSGLSAQLLLRMQRCGGDTAGAG